MHLKSAVWLVTAVWASNATAQKPPAISYTLTIDTADLSAFSVELRMRGAADTFTLAAAAHPEYDDKYWRYIEDLRVTGSAGKAATVVRSDSVLWRVSNPGGEVLVRYRIRLPQPPAPRAAWRAFLTPTGGLVGGPHSFLYVVGAERAQASVNLNMPDSWQVATGLERNGRTTYHARDIAMLMDSPMFIGRMSQWQFSVNGIPHRIFYWRLPDAAAFDTAAFVNDIERFTRQTITLFGSAPYREYTFMFQDGAFGGLEHANSVTLGAPSADLARNPHAYLPETAHEFFHTWNLVRIRPREYRDLDYRTQPPVAGLWFSEGLTIFYADLLARRAGLPTSDSTRLARLENILGRYHSSPGNMRFSAEQVSRVAYNAPPGSLGDYDASTHLQGEIIGTMLDLIIRGATNGTRSMDDVMRLMLERFSNDRGFVGTDVEQAVRTVCGCDVKSFFDAHVRGGTPIDVDRYLAVIGLRARVTNGPALTNAGDPTPDTRIRAYLPPGQDKLSLLLWHPESIWVRAGFHTGDRLVSLNGAHLNSWAEFRAAVVALRIGDTARLVVERPAGLFEASVEITGYDRPFIHIEELENATAGQGALRAAWLKSQ